MTQTKLIAVLQHPYADTLEGTLQFFSALVDAIRPGNTQSAEGAAAAFTALSVIAEGDARHRA